MSITERTRGVASRAGEAAASAASTARRQARRAQLELTHHRLETRVRDAYADLGKTLYPLVERGAIVVEVPGVDITMATIAGLLASERANQEEIDRLRQPPQAGGPAGA